MESGWQQLVAAGIVVIAAMWWVRHLYLRVRGRRGGGCGKSCGCARPPSPRDSGK